MRKKEKRIGESATEDLEEIKRRIRKKGEEMGSVKILRFGKEERRYEFQEWNDQGRENNVKGKGEDKNKKEMEENRING